MSWKRVAVWIGVALAVGWGIWLYRFLSPPPDPSSAYTNAPACTNGVSDGCKERTTAVVGDKASDGSYHRAKTYALKVRARDNRIHDVAVDKDTFGAAKSGDTVEIERWNGRVTRLWHDGAEVTLPDRIRPPSKGKLRAAFTALLLASVWLVVKTLRARKREATKT